MNEVIKVISAKKIPGTLATMIGISFLGFKKPYAVQKAQLKNVASGCHGLPGRPPRLFAI